MSRHSKRRKKNVAPDSSDFRVDPFSDLDEFVEVPEPDPEDKADAPPAPSESVPETSRSRVPPLVIRHQRKGRSGKTVTLVQGLESLDTTEQMELLRDIRRGLGIGGRFDDDLLELQGDQRSRAAAWFRENGFRVHGA